MSEEKRGRGKPPGSLKPNARRVAIKIRWTDAEVERIRAAAARSGEDFSSFVRAAALARCKKI
jgi:uncharacterized protein (DUF1778 family)